MNIQITKEQERPLLKRKDIECKVEYESKTPTREEIRTTLAHMLKTKKELVIVETIKPAYGVTAANVKAKAYSDEAVMKEIEPTYTMKKHFPEIAAAEKEKKAAASAKKE